MSATATASSVADDDVFGAQQQHFDLKETVHLPQHVILSEIAVL